MSAVNDEPSTLYHYTDAYGLAGIVQPSWPYPIQKPEHEIGYHRTVKLFASDVRFMNDTEELKFGTRLMRQRLDAASREPSIPRQFQTAFAEIAPSFDAERILNWPVGCLATCFCAEPDLLSQWRGYAGGTGGFALGLDRDGLENRTHALNRSRWPGSPGPPSTPTLKPVVYGEEAGLTAIDDYLKSIIDSEWKSVITDERPQARPMGRFFLFSMLIRGVATIKAEAFSEENEWRSFSLSQFDFPVDVRARARGLVPYVNVAVNVSEKQTPVEQAAHFQEHPTIVDLVVGPGPEQTEQVVAARELLKGAGHDPEVVRPSKVSYRG